MSQNSVDFSGDPSGDELLDDLLTPQQENFLSSHSGTSRPSYAIEGTEWIDKTTTPWIVKRFDGTDDIIVGYIDATANTYTPAGLILDKVDATTAPTINDDDADGYAVGSKWVDVTNDRGYLCVDSSTGAAVWKEITGSFTGQSSSVDGELCLFSGTSGRVAKRATGTGYVKVVSGVMQTPAATVPLSDLANQAAQSVVINATGSSAAPTAVAIAASKLVGRGSSGNLGEISLGMNLSMSGSTLNVLGTNGADRQVFTSSGTWNKPSGYDSTAMALIEGWGAGAGGGSGVANGNNGGASSFGSLLTAYGGTGGSINSSSQGGAAGGYNATASAGSRANDTGFEGYGNSTGTTKDSTGGFYTGGGGGAGSTASTTGVGRPSVYGGAGGGGASSGVGGTSSFGGNGANAPSGTATAPGGGGAGGNSGGGGGGGGSYKFLWVPLSSLSSSETVTIGSAGAAGGGANNGTAGARGEIRVTVFG